MNYYGKPIYFLRTAVQQQYTSRQTVNISMDVIKSGEVLMFFKETQSGRLLDGASAQNDSHMNYLVTAVVLFAIIRSK